MIRLSLHLSADSLLIPNVPYEIIMTGHRSCRFHKFYHLHSHFSFFPHFCLTLFIPFVNLDYYAYNPLPQICQSSKTCTAKRPCTLSHCCSVLSPWTRINARGSGQNDNDRSWSVTLITRGR